MLDAHFQEESIYPRVGGTTYQTVIGRSPLFRTTCWQRCIKMETLETSSVLNFSSCANFLVLHAMFCTSLRIFAQFCCFFAHFCTFLHIFAHFCTFLHIFARFCSFFAHIFCANFSDSKFRLCYFLSFIHLCATSTTYVPDKAEK